MPTNMIAAMNSDVATGRRMNGRDGLSAMSPSRIDHGRDGAAAGGGDVDAAVDGERRVTLAPFLSLSAPSTTTRSPACNPLRIATFSPADGPSVTGRTDAISSAPTT